MADVPRNLSRTGYTTDTSITPQNVAQLHQRWRVSVSGSISAQPIVSDGVVYWSDWNGFHLRHDAVGESPVVHLPGHHTETTTLHLPPGHLGYRKHADAWHHQRATCAVDGRRPRTDGRARRLQREDRLADATSYCTREHDLELSGLLQREHLRGCGLLPRMPPGTRTDRPAQRGDGYPPGGPDFLVICARQVPRTGRMVVAGRGPDENAIFIGTSNDFCNSPYQDAIVKLNPSTMHITSIWQVPLSQHPADSDFGASPMLFSAAIGGANEQLVGA